MLIFQSQWDNFEFFFIKYFLVTGKHVHTLPYAGDFARRLGCQILAKNWV